MTIKNTISVFLALLYFILPAKAAKPPLFDLQPNAVYQVSVLRVFVGRVCEEDGRRYWQVGFGVEGPRLGFVGGTVESDGRGCNLDLHADRAETCELLKRRRGDVREELEGTALPVRFIGISRSAVERLRNRLLSGRGLDLTV